MKCNFSFAHYKEVLEYAKSKGYFFFRFRDHKDSLGKKKAIFLRHDIDFTLKNALVIAEIEKKLGIASTYFIRVDGNYNPFSYQNYGMIKKIIAFGHEIALHYTPDYASFFGEEHVELFKRQKKYLENAVNREILGISTHEPGNSKFQVEDSDLKKFGLKYQAYSTIFTKDMKYISESSGRWREGCMCNFIKKNAPKLSILTHPIWWFEKTPLENY